MGGNIASHFFLLILIYLIMKSFQMNKNAAAALEPSSVTDPRTGRIIRVAVPVRIKYREYFRGQTVGQNTREILHSLSNKELNDEIAKDFVASANDVAHMFLSKDSDKTATPPKLVWMEIRKQQRGSRAIFNFFISKINESFIDILMVSQKYFKPKKPRIVKAEDKVIKYLLDSFLKEGLEKIAKKNNKFLGQNTGEIIAAVRARGKSLKKTKKEINNIIAMIKKIEELGIKNNKNKEHIIGTINSKLPVWCLEKREN